MFLANLYRDFSCTPTISTSLSEEAMFMWPLRLEASLRDSSTCTCPETNKQTMKNKRAGGRQGVALGEEDASIRWLHGLTVTLDQTQSTYPGVKGQLHST